MDSITQWLIKLKHSYLKNKTNQTNPQKTVLKTNVFVWIDDTKTYFWGLFPLFFLGDINDEQKHPNYSCQNVGTCSILKTFNILILPSVTAESSLYAEKYNNLVQSGSLVPSPFEHNPLSALLKKWILYELLGMLTLAQRSINVTSVFMCRKVERIPQEYQMSHDRGPPSGSWKEKMINLSSLLHLWWTGVNTGPPCILLKF